jgi:serine/threonine protein kinase/predicted TPR repeat methyltransferase
MLPNTPVDSSSENEDPTIPFDLAQSRRDGQGKGAVSAGAWGSFTLLARVGGGGFGEVYRAWDPQLQREVALKLLLPGAEGSDADFEAMLREARALASVRHPNIVPVYGIDRHNERVGFWTDFVRGKTLAALVTDQGTLGPHETALIGLDVARALSAVHRSGHLHRDIKAENVMREEGGRILLMDFGLSVLNQRESGIAGTPNYMAPELFDGAPSTAASDMYAMGVLLFFLVTGDYPARLSGLGLREAMKELSRRRPLIDLRPDLPESLLRTVSTAMELDPTKRFTSAGQLANALAESLGAQELVEVSASPEREHVQKIRRKWFWGIRAAAVTLAISLVWFVALYKPMSGPSSSNSSLSTTADDEFLSAQNLLMHSYKESNLAEAVKGFKAVLDKDPHNALAKARLGQAYLAQHGYTNDPKLLDAAKDATNQAIKLNQELAAPYITLARIAALEGQTQFATQQLQKALELEPRSADVHGARGEVYESQGRGKDALSEYQQAIDLAPDDWRWPMSAGVAEYRLGNIDNAIAQLQHAAELAPDNAMAYYDLSIAHRQSGQLQQAGNELERSLQLDPTARKYAALGSLFLFEGKYDQAVQMEQKAIELNPESYVAYGNLAAAYAWSGANHDKVVQACRKAIDLEEVEHAKRPQDATLLANLADLYATIGNSGKSLILVRQALALAPDDPTANYTTGDALELLGRR